MTRRLFCAAIALLFGAWLWVQVTLPLYEMVLGDLARLARR